MMIVLCLYVDDMLICGTSMCIILEIKSLLASNFDMKDMGEAKLIFGVKIIRNENCILLS